jgi:PAS domain S-box-containing protein
MLNSIVVMDMSSHFFTSGPFMPHGGCYLWTTSLIALHAIADALIVLAYYSIPVTLVYFVRRRRDLKFHWMFVCFAVFILACGTTHLMEIWNIWHANYWLSGSIKAITALASVPTAILLVKLIPQALALPSPGALHKAYGELEQRVVERTRQLEAANETLKREVQERQRAEQQLQNSFKEISDLKAALDEHAIVAITDPQGKITYVNDKFCAISRYAREELLGRDHRLINSGYHSKEFIHNLWTTISHGKVWKGEIKNRAKDGTFYWVDTTIVPFLNKDAKPRQYVAIRADITERKQAEELLKASFKEVEDLKAALDEHAIVAITDPQGKITYVNDKFCAISKYAREELLGQDHRLINSGYHSKEFIRNLWATIMRGRVWKGEIKNRAKDGSFYWVDTTIVPFLNKDDKPRQYVAIRADITERKQAEVRLRESEQRFATMANSIPQLAWIARADGFILWYNQRWYEYTGTTAEQMEGWGWQSVHDPQLLPEVMAKWKVAIAAGRPFEMEFPLRGADECFRRFLTRAQPFLNASGQVEQWFGTNTDVDELKRVEAEIKTLNAELEQRVAERTAELEAANKDLEAFSYSVSHDLRAPLRAVNGFAGIVLEDFGRQIPEEGRRHLERIRNGGQRMGRLIDDLLAFSRLNRQSVNRQSVDSARLVREALDELKPQREGRQLELRIAELPPCQADPALLKQVWVNLLSNAIKYSRDRAPAVVEIGARQEERENVFFVRDNGAGFDMQYGNKLFGVFQRLHRADQFEGTGVGLAIVQRIVQRHGGRVWAEGKVDQGATFYFTLEGENKP